MKKEKVYMIYVISNVEYPEENKLHPNPEDMLVFINKAKSIDYYKDHPNKAVYRRFDKPDYGEAVPGVDNYCVFGDTGVTTKEFRKSLPYDYNYDPPKDVIKSPTTGYVLVKYLEYKYPEQGIILVNFGYEVEKSTFRSSNHNWIFENRELSKYKHIYTAPTINRSELEVVYCCDTNYLEQFRMSARSVLKHNPNAHITVVSSTPLDVNCDNVVVDTSKYNFRHVKNDRISSAAYLKLFLPECLPYDKVIFIDCDTICRGPLEELNNIKVPYIGLCHSFNAGIKQAEQIGIPMYGLSSLMVMNLANLREENLTERAMEYMHTYDFPDTRWHHEETILNCCFYELLKFIDTKWCFTHGRSYSNYNERTALSHALIVHFMGKQLKEQREYFRIEMGIQ